MISYVGEERFEAIGAARDGQEYDGGQLDRPELAP
jgi:hypothetical protein